MMIVRFAVLPVLLFFVSTRGGERGCRGGVLGCRGGGEVGGGEVGLPKI